MMYEWQADHIRFMRDAAAYGNYHHCLAKKLLPYLPPGGRICDAGCGLGDLALALAPYFREITACDLSPEAIRELRSKVRNVDNLQIICGDLAENPPRTCYDGMVFCLFGATQQMLDIARQQCRGTVCVINRGSREHRFSVENQPLHADNANQTALTLRKMSVPFYTEEFSLEFGQPFRSREDAMSFFALYSGVHRKITWEDVSARLVETGRRDFPYYAPEKKKLSLLCFDSRDLL